MMKEDILHDEWLGTFGRHTKTAKIISVCALIAIPAIFLFPNPTTLALFSGIYQMIFFIVIIVLSVGILRSETHRVVITREKVSFTIAIVFPIIQEIPLSEIKDVKMTGYDEMYDIDVDKFRSYGDENILYGAHLLWPFARLQFPWERWEYVMLSFKDGTYLVFSTRDAKSVKNAFMNTKKVFTLGPSSKRLSKRGAL